MYFLPLTKNNPTPDMKWGPVCKGRGLLFEEGEVYPAVDFLFLESGVIPE